MNKEIKISPNQIKNAIDMLLDEKEQLQQENKQLKKRINKAIKYIKFSAFYPDMCEVEDAFDMYKILKGDSNENN